MTTYATTPNPIAETVVQIPKSTTTAELDVSGGAGGSGSESILIAQVDNTGNTARSYTKVYNIGAVTAGVTVPELILPCPGGASIEYVFIDGVPMAEGGGGAANSGIAIRTVIEPGTAGATSPTTAVEVRLLVDT